MQLRHNAGEPEFFGPGPIKLITYLTEKEIKPRLVISWSDGYIESRTPVRFELIKPQISLDIYIIHCGDAFQNFMLTNLQDRLWFKLGRGNKMGIKYRVYPTGTIAITK